MLKMIDVIIALDLDVFDRKLPELQECISGVSIDTRTLQKDNVYIAIKGESTDGHLFIKDAITKGASAMVIENEDFIVDCLNVTYFLVSSTQKALEKLAMASRVKVSPNAKIIALTGSVGKTTLKEFLSALTSPFLKTVCSKKSFNNHLGVPLTLCDLKEDTECGIFEVGMNHKGEIKPLSFMVSPHIAIITAIEAAHIGHLGSVDAIAAEKSDIFSGINEGGTAILPFDSPYINFLTEKALSKASKIITIGRNEGATLRLMSITYSEKGATVWARIYGKEYTFDMPVFADHYVTLALFAIASCIELGLNVRDLLPHVKNLSALPGRGNVETITFKDGREITLIDDSYNANIASMKAGLSVFSKIEGKRKIAILGEMAELGDFKESIYEELGKYVGNIHLEALFTIGSDIDSLKSFKDSKTKYIHAKTVEEIIPPVLKTLKTGDVVFIKGSNINRLSVLVNDLKNE